MRITVRVLGLELLDIAATRDEDDDDQSLRPPFGFSGSGLGLVETADDVMPDVSDSVRPGR